MPNKSRMYSFIPALLVVFAAVVFSACNGNSEKKEPEVKTETTVKQMPPDTNKVAKPDSIDTTGIIKPVIPTN